MYTFILKTALAYGAKRLIDLYPPFIDNPTLEKKKCKEELVAACIMGELSAYERLLTHIIKHPEDTRGDIEAVLHKTILECNNHISKLESAFKSIKMDELLKMRGYYDE